MTTIILFIVRGSAEVEILKINLLEERTSEEFKNKKKCKFIAFSPHGQYFACANDQCLEVYLTDKWSLQFEKKISEIQFLFFSPLDTHIVTWIPSKSKNNN